MKRSIAIALAAIILLTFAGCTQSPTTTTAPATTAPATTSPATTAPPTTAAPPTAPSKFPLTVTDQSGTPVTIDAPAQRIVSGYYISSSACIALGLADRLVGTEERIESRPIYALSAPQLIGAIANVGSAKAFELEACIAAEPDLVILPLRAKDHAATLAEMGIPAIVVSPEDHDSLIEMIELIAALTDTQEGAAKLIARYDDVLATLEGITAGLSDTDKPSVYVCNPGTYMSTAPKDMYQASLVRSAGGINAANSLDGNSWTDVSYEQILAMNPDVIIIPTNNMANGQPDYSAADVIADANLAGITAIENGAVYNMPAGLEAWDSPVPSSVLGMLWLLNKLHPELYSDSDFQAQATDFYKTFYGFTMDPSILAK